MKRISLKLVQDFLKQNNCSVAGVVNVSDDFDTWKKSMDNDLKDIKIKNPVFFKFIQNKIERLINKHIEQYPFNKTITVKVENDALYKDIVTNGTKMNNIVLDKFDLSIYQTDDYTISFEDFAKFEFCSAEMRFSEEGVDFAVANEIRNNWTFDLKKKWKEFIKENEEVLTK